MARQITETFFGYDQPDVWIAVDGTEYRGEIRAKATDGDPDTNQGCIWWAFCNVRYALGDNRLEWHPADHVRLDVDQLDGLDFIRSRPVGGDGAEIIPPADPVQSLTSSNVASKPLSGWYDHDTS